MVLFVANTQTQLLNASNLATTTFRNVECDLYYKEILADKAESLHKQNFFKNVYKMPLEEEKNSRQDGFSKISRALNYIKRKRRIQKELPSSPLRYTDIFISSGNLKLIVLYYWSKKINKKIRLNLYEEGLFEYCELIEKKSLLRILFSYIFFGRYYLIDCENLYVYRPDIIESRWKNIRIVQIPPIQKNKKIQAISQAWSYRNILYLGQKGYVVFFDQSFFDDRIENEQKRLLQFISETVGKEKILIKLHPKSKQFKYGEQYEYLNYNYPIELIALNDNIENNIFISLQSSAAINLKIMLRLQSMVILLSDLIIWPRGIHTTANDVIKRLASPDEYLFVPNTEKQLENILKNIPIIKEDYT